MQRSIIAQVCILSIYVLGCLAIIYAYVMGWHIQGFSLSAILIVLGSVFTIVSVRRYKQRLNYVEGLEAITLGSDRNIQSSNSVLKTHWIDILGDHGVGFINLLLILIAIPGLLGHASLLPQMFLFDPPRLDSHGFGFGTWVSFVILDLIGAIEFVLHQVGLEDFSNVEDIRAHLASHWHWFMLVVQIGLLSLAFDIFRRYLDLSALLDRLVSSIELSSETFTQHENNLQCTRLDPVASDYELEEKFSRYLQYKNESLARVETLARFLCVFPKKRLVLKVINLVYAQKTLWSHRVLCEEGRSSLLLALSFAGMRIKKPYMTKLAHHTAFKLLNDQSSIKLRIVSLDTLNGVYTRHHNDRPKLSDIESNQLLEVAKKQLKVASIYAISTDRSIEYEKLCLAAAFTLCVAQNNSAILPLLILNFSDSKRLKEEANERLHALLKRLTEGERQYIQNLIDLIEAAKQQNEPKVEESLYQIQTLIDDRSRDDQIDKILPLDFTLIHFVLQRVAHSVRGSSILRTLVREVAKWNVSFAAQALWSVMMEIDSKEVRYGLAEGMDTSPDLIHLIHLQVLSTLLHGMPHEVEKALSLCPQLTDKELSYLPEHLLRHMKTGIVRLSHLEQDQAHSKRILRQLRNLSLGLAKSQVSSKAKDLIGLILSDLDLIKDQRLAPIKCVLKAVGGDEDTLGEVFKDYLHALSLRRRGLSVTDSKLIISQDIIEYLDPSLKVKAARWERLLSQHSQVDNTLSKKVANELSKELITEFVISVTPVKWLWLLNCLDEKVDVQLRSSLLQYLGSRLKFLEHNSLKPLFSQSILEWLFEFVSGRIRTESHLRMQRQWLRLHTHILMKLKPSTYFKRGISTLQQVLEARDLKVNAELRGLAAEEIGKLGRVRASHELSQYLVSQFMLGQPFQQIINGICKGLSSLGDHIARSFFVKQSKDRSRPLIRSAFISMVECLDEHQEHQVLSMLLADIDTFYDDELIALCRTLSSRNHISTYTLEQQSKERIRIYILERLQETNVIGAVHSACVTLVPLCSSRKDDEVCRQLFSILMSVNKQTLFEQITRVIAEVFPDEYKAEYSTTLEKLPPFLKPKWILGWGHIESSGEEYNSSKMMRSELLRWLEPNLQFINAENILSISTQLLLHGQGKDRSYVYDWMKDPTYKQIAYALVQRVKHVNRPDLDAPRLKDELNRLRSLERMRTKDHQERTVEELEYSVKFEIELLDTLTSFEHMDAHLELIKLAVQKPLGYRQTRLQQLARTKLSDPLKINLGIDESVE